MSKTSQPARVRVTFGRPSGSFGPRSVDARAAAHARLRTEALAAIDRLAKSAARSEGKAGTGGDAALTRLIVESGRRLAAGREPAEIAALFRALSQMAAGGAFSHDDDPLVTLLAYWQRNVRRNAGHSRGRLHA